MEQQPTAQLDPGCDFYDLSATLAKEDQELLKKVRSFMRTEVTPLINHHWTREEFPMHLIKEMASLGATGLPYSGYGCLGRSSLLDGFVAMEMASFDCSISTFFGVHSGLAMGSIYLCGSEEQKEQWLPAMMAHDKIGAFALTEPFSGSDVAKGLRTTARREGDTWILNGQKKWIGNATFADVNVVWARDEADNQVKGFLVEKGTKGFIAEKMTHKIALRVVQNAEITFDHCRVPEANRLKEANSFADCAKVLRMTRAGVAWQAVGCMRGAYEITLQYVKERKQFGRPIGGFQMVQDRLANMLANITSAQTLCYRLSQLQDEGNLKEEHASLAKMFCTVKMRETVGLARELMGGNGILLDYHVGRFVADAEALYSYEGTREINALIVGRAITGQSAFV